MSTHPDLTLPAKAPGMERYHNTPMKLLPVALYTIVDLTDNELRELREACESQCDQEPESTVRLAPRCKFVGEPLRAAFDYHLELGRAGAYDPTYFIAAISRDWRSDGVFVVTLETDDELDGDVDSFRSKAEDSGVIMVNLQIANSSWAEENEGYALDDDDGGDDDDDDDDNDNDNDDDDDDHKDNEDDNNNNHSDSNQPSKPPPVGFFIGVYTVQGLNEKTLLKAIEPAAEVKTPEEFCCRIQASLPPDSDIIAEACKMHPQKVLQNKFLHKQMFLVADSTNIQNDGIALVHIDWDGNVSDKSAEMLQDIGKTSARKTQRCECRQAVPTLCTIAGNYRKWSYNHWRFGVYTVNYPDADIKIAQLLDKQWVKRGHGQDRVVLGPGLPDPKPADNAAFWMDVVRAHASVCERTRFSSNFQRQLCFVCDNDEPGAKGVWLVKFDWDGELGPEGKGREELLKRDYDSVLTVQRCSVAEALKTLADVADGKKSWQGVVPP